MPESTLQAGKAEPGTEGGTEGVLRAFVTVGPFPKVPSTNIPPTGHVF